MPFVGSALTGWRDSSPSVIMGHRSHTHQSESSSDEMWIELTRGGIDCLGGWDVAVCAAIADPEMNAGWLVLMYAAWISMRLRAYSDVGPRRSRKSSDTHSISCA